MNHLLKHIAVFLLPCLGLAQQGSRIPVIPEPAELAVPAGISYFEIRDKIIIENTVAEFSREAGAFAENFKIRNIVPKEITGKKSKKQKSPEPHICFYRDTSIQQEGYQIWITSQEIGISARSGAGIFYAMQTFFQMADANRTDGKITLASIRIRDYPRFAWRGMHLDVSRHFFPPAFIKKYIDLLATYKMNVFHWHLTDDQGWRIEIKKFPLLTAVGGWRNGSMVGPYSDQRFDSVRYGGYYTQDEIRAIVKYADERHITIVPEIEMPGHARAALAAYPQYACTGIRQETARSWGVFDDVFCAGNDSTFAFLQAVLDEVCALFPGKYIHIGGDECPKTRWKSCSKCQLRMKDAKLEDEHALQSYFIQRMEKYLNAKGKQIIGWDEILEGGLAPNAAVMSWRGTEGGIEAAKQHHFVVMSPGSHCYFDHYQSRPEYEPLAIGGYTPLEKVYAWEPVPATLPEEDRKYILGAQANVWTEYITTTAQVEYMALPRMLALAEVLWTQPARKALPYFLTRLYTHEKWLHQRGYNVSLSYRRVFPQISRWRTGLGVQMKFETPPLYASVLAYMNISHPPARVFNGMVMSFSDKDSLFIMNTGALALFSDYPECDTLWTDFYINKATSAHVKVDPAPAENFSRDDFTLTDGMRGGSYFKPQEWLGWKNEAEIVCTIDLESEKEITRVAITCMTDVKRNMQLPREIVVQVSADGMNFRNVESMRTRNGLPAPTTITSTFEKTNARYVKLIIKSGSEAAEKDKQVWTLISEIGIE